MRRGLLALLMVFLAVHALAAPPNPQAGEVSRAVDLFQPALDIAWAKLSGDAMEALPAFIHPRAGDGTVRRMFQTFQARYYHLCESILRHIRVQDEIRHANHYFGDFFAPSDNDPDLLKRVKGLADTLSSHAPKKSAIHETFAALTPAWQDDPEGKRVFRVGVLNGPGMTIFAKGGDMIVVSREIAEFPDDELAGVLAHEMVHLLNRDFLRAAIIREVNQRWVVRCDPAKRAQFKKMMEYCFWYWQRVLEFETDIQALDLLKKARFDPDGLAAALKRMSGANSREFPKKNASSLAGTSHCGGVNPSPEERRNALIRLMTRLRPAQP